MKITHLTSSTEIIEVNNIKIMMDPWLDDGIYYGSWYIYPKYDYNTYDLSTIDYIYISHIHADHCCDETLKKLDKSIPVLIHSYVDKFLKRKLEFLGFQVRELENNKRIHLENGVYINILAADNCNPAICGKAFGCYVANLNGGGSTQIDSLCVIDNDEYVLLNTNDCHYQIAYEAIQRVLKEYKKIDFLLVGYTRASLYPYAMSDYSEAEMKKAQESCKARMLDFGCKILEQVKPKYFMPFAGTYILGGRLWELNKYTPSPELEEAVEYMTVHSGVKEYGTQGILLNSGETFDISTGTQTKEYVPINPNERWNYIENVISKFGHEFDEDKTPTIEDFEELIPKAYQRYNDRWDKTGYNSDTQIFIQLTEGKLLSLSSNKDTGYKIIDATKDGLKEPYIYFDLDPKLFYRILKGPRYAHWNNMEVGALLKMSRKPDVYEMGIHLRLCYLHA